MIVHRPNTVSYILLHLYCYYSNKQSPETTLFKMESNQELYKQAILDAKAVRETAMAAARTTLAEHFEPTVKQMFKETVADMEEGMDEYAEEQPGDMEHAHRVAEVDESTLEEILAELDALSEDMEQEGTDDLEEGHVPEDGYVGKASKGQTGYDEKAKTSHGDHKLHEAEEDEKEEEDDEAEEAGEDLTKGIEAEEGGDDQEVVDITVGDLKDIIRDVFMQLQGGADMATDDAALDADTDLAADLGTDDELGAEDEEEISLEEILAELENEGKVEEAALPGEIPGGQVDPTAKDVFKVERELNEAVKTIKTLKAELNEMNLFNAKMLYVNKIFKSKTLNEAQKTKVINAFDRATSVKEVENTYKTLLESVGEATKKSSLKESVGFASKPIGSAPARPIVEADAFVTRWQQLAGIR
jgi:hypothetical protein